MNLNLLGAAIYLVLFVVAVLFMFALGRVAAKADRDAESLGSAKPVGENLAPVRAESPALREPHHVYGHRVQAVDGKPIRILDGEDLR